MTSSIETYHSLLVPSPGGRDSGRGIKRYDNCLFFTLTLTLSHQGREKILSRGI
jgi:hypothetical protein